MRIRLNQIHEIFHDRVQLLYNNNCKPKVFSLNHWKMKENTKRFRNRIDSKELENYFDRLPTELINSIFERIVDAKCLCICYSVSKSFAAHVVQTRFVSLEIPYAIGQSGWLPVWPPGIINFLKKLCYVESATIQFSLPSSSHQASKPLVWWKSDSFGFIFVFAESRQHDHDDTIKATSEFTCRAFYYSIQNHLRDFMLRLRYIKELLVLPNLKHISAVDSMKQGRIIMEEQGIANMKMGNAGQLCIKMWVARKVKLPLSGCVMKNVGLICDGLRAETLLEENEYRQVAMTMMKKHTCSQIRTLSAVGPTIADSMYKSLSLLMPACLY